MSKLKPTNMSASVRQRLLTLSHQRREEYQFVLIRYVLERFLYRLARSPHASQFVLKGAMLVQAWVGQEHRPTMDADLLGHGDPSLPRIEAAFRAICRQQVEDDGVVFDPEQISVVEIRKDGKYRGVRVLAVAGMGSARIPVQVDIGFGDVVIPPPKPMIYPTLLDMAPPVLEVYPRETVIAEKYEAMVGLGIANSRMKDFYDVWMLAERCDFSGDILGQAIIATFARRETALPAGLPAALSAEFSSDHTKRLQWDAFLRKGRLRTAPPDLSDLCTALERFLWPVTVAASSGGGIVMYWAPGGPWKGL